jgi:tripeptidyl-peptidase-1
MQVILYLAALWAAAAATPLSMEELQHVPEGWHSVGIPDSSRSLHFRIAMTQPREGLFEQTLLDISTPGHSRYGKHLKRKELKDMLRPTPQATSAVMDWLQAEGVYDIEDKGEWINFVATTAQAESLLDTKFAIYHHELSNIDKVRTLHYSVPDDLHRYIDMIQPTTRFGDVRPQRSQVLDVKRLSKAQSKIAAANSSCDSAITPDCLKELYSIPTQGVQLKDNETSGFAAFTNYLEEYPRYADLATFEKNYAPYANRENFTWQVALV